MTLEPLPLPCRVPRAATMRSTLDDFVARARQMPLREELDTAALAAVSALAAGGIEALLLKGPALSRRLYTEAESRGYSDVDLLVSRKDLAPARAVLTRLGYALGEESLGVDDVADIQHSEVWARAGDGGGPLLIDLHWRLAGCQAADELAWEALAAARGLIELRGQPTAVLSDEGLALHVALHAAQHGPEDFKAMGDLARAIERWPAELWARAAQLAHDLEGVPAFVAGLSLQPRGVGIARELALPPTPGLTWEIRHRGLRPRGTFHLRALHRAAGSRTRANVLMRSLFPNRLWIQREFPWAVRGRALLGLAYARHVVRTPVWVARAALYLGRARRAAARS